MQATAEAEPLADAQFALLLALARQGAAELMALQRKVLGLE